MLPDWSRFGFVRINMFRNGSGFDTVGAEHGEVGEEDLLDVGEGGEEGGAEAVDKDDVAVVGVGLEVGDTVQRHADEFVACVEVEGVVGGAEAAHVGVLHLGKIERFGYR